MLDSLIKEINNFCNNFVIIFIFELLKIKYNKRNNNCDLIIIDNLIILCLVN